MPAKDKHHLIIRKDKLNKWFTHETNWFRLQLSWDPRKDWYWISQYAKKLGKDTFMKDLTDILSEMEKDGKSAFNLYEY